MKIAIHQPQYFPWIRYLQKIMSADVFVYLDTVQFSKNGVQNRNQIKTPQGAQWITIPVKQKLGQKIMETEIADQNALSKHVKTLAMNYSQTEGFKRWKEDLENLLNSKPTMLCEIAISSTEWMLNKIGTTTKRVKASELKMGHGEKNSELVAEICAQLNADFYLTGTGALEYMQKEHFTKIGCEVLVQETKDFTYHQTFLQKGFIPHLSALDLILNCPNEAGPLLVKNMDWSPAWP